MTASTHPRAGGPGPARPAPPAPRRRSGETAWPLVAVLPLALLLSATGCTNAAVDTAVGTTAGSAGIVASRTSTGIAIENRVGRPLLNVRIVIESGGTAFAHTLPTLEPGRSREIPFADFRTDDGLLYEAGASGAPDVKVTARDTLGNTHETSAPPGR